MPVIVLGMHRSGTSALTRCLNLLGLSLGGEDNMLLSGPENERGFWENAHLSSLNEDILTALNGVWLAPPMVAPSWWKDQRLASLKERAGKLLANTFYDHSWCWKDPRNCITLPFWLELLEQRPVIVFVQRNPLEVWKSLEQRNGFTKTVSLALWYIYNYYALYYSTSLPVLVCTYSELLGDPIASLRRMMGFLQSHGFENLSMPSDEAVKDFLAPDMRHWSFEDHDCIEDPEVLPEQKRLLTIMQDLLPDSDRFVVPDLPDRSFLLKAHLEVVQNHVGILRDSLRQKKLDEMKEHIEEYDKCLRLQNSRVDQLQAKLEEYDKLLIDARKQVQDQQSTLKSLAPLVSIVVICWNNRRFLKRCFDSLLRTNYPKLEIFLADNASTDGSASYIAEHYPSVRVIVHPSNLGFAEGNNRAIRQTHGKYVITLNPDTEVDPEWINAMLEVAESDPTIDMISPKMFIMDRGKLLNSAGGDMLLRSGDNLARGFYLEDDGRFDRVEETFGPSAGAGFYRRAMLDDIGLFDKGLFTYYEDVDLNLRAQLRGYRCKFVPAAMVYHYQAGTLDDNNPFKLFLLQRNKWYVVLKNFPLRLMWHCRRELARSYVAGWRHLRSAGHGTMMFKVHLSLFKRLPRIVVFRCAGMLRNQRGATRRIADWMDRHEDTYRELDQAAAVGRYYEDLKNRQHANSTS